MGNTKSFVVGLFLTYLIFIGLWSWCIFKETSVPFLSRNEQKHAETLMGDLVLLLKLYHRWTVDKLFIVSNPTYFLTCLLADTKQLSSQRS